MYPRTVPFGGLFRISILTVFSLGLASTVSAQEPPRTPKEKPNGEAVTLEVQNNNFMDMHIYVMKDGFVRSLGVVTGLTTEELTIPEVLTLPGAEIQILAAPIGSRLSYLTDPIVVETGETVELMLQSELGMSTYSLRQRAGRPTSDASRGSLEAGLATHSRVRVSHA
jgi:hypothetical protein